MALDKPASTSAPKTAPAPAPAKPVKPADPAPTSTSTADAKKSAKTVKPAAAPATSPDAATTTARDGATQTAKRTLEAARREVGASLTQERPPVTGGGASKPAPPKPATGETAPAPEGDKGSKGSTSKPSPPPAAPTQRDPALEAQQQALGDAFSPGADQADRDRANAYFQTNQSYIDPSSGVEYQARYDAASGDLTLTRDDVPVSASQVPGGADVADDRPLDAPGEPLQAATPVTRGRGSGKLGNVGGAAGATSGGASLMDIAANITVQAVLDGETGKRMGVGKAINEGVEQGVALLGERGRIKGQRESVGAVTFDRTGESSTPPDAGTPAALDVPTQYQPAVAPERATAVPGKPGAAADAEMDEVIVVSADGSRDTTRTFVVRRDDGGNVTAVEEVQSTSDGVVTGGRVERTATRSGAQGSESTRTVDTYGQGGVLSGRERNDVTRSPDGAVTTDQGRATFEAGRPTGMQQDLEYRFGPVTAREQTTTTYTDGRRASAQIRQTARDSSDNDFLWFGVEDGEETIRVTYDAEGEVSTVSGQDPTSEGSPLNRIVGDQPTAAGERFAFSSVRAAPGEIDGVSTPGLVSGPGMVVDAGGVRVFQEGGRPGQGGPNAQQLADVREYIRNAPPQMVDDLDAVDLVDGRNPQDSFWEVRYGIDGFTSAATGGGGRMTFYLNGNSQGTFNHEAGHISGVESGAPDDDAWRQAMQGDNGIDDDFLAQGEVVSDGGVAGGGKLGVTSYGDQSFASSGNESEDWAESVELWLASRNDGELITVRLPDGTEKTATFEELFPNRARILEDYYGTN